MLIPCIYTPVQRSWWGIYWNHLVRLSVCPSVFRRHGLRSITEVCFRIFIWNFICMLLVAMGRSLLILSDVTFKMAAWRPSWIIWFRDLNCSLALDIKYKLECHITCVWEGAYWFSTMSLSKWPPGSHIEFCYIGTLQHISCVYW